MTATIDAGTWRDVEIGSDEWLRLMTASKVAAVLGLSKYDSPRSLWHKMRGDVPREEQTVIQARGHYLEPAILAWFFDQHPELTARYPKTFVAADGWRATSPDALGHDASQGVTVGVEAKTAADDEEWGTPGTDEIPVSYAAQCTWTAHVLGLPRVYVPMIDHRLAFQEYVVEYKPEIAEGIERRCKALLDSLDGEPPEVDNHPATYDSLRRVNPQIEDRKVYLDRDQARRAATAKRRSDAAEAELLLAKSTLAELMGTAKQALYGDELIARRQNTGSGVAALYWAKTLPDFGDTND
jgi:hypothetical protein